MHKITKLPQTKEEYKDLKRNQKLFANEIAINEGFVHQPKAETEPEIAPMVQHLLCKNLSQKKTDEQLVNFFRAYDDYKEEKILKLQMKVDRQKAKNKKLRNAQAGAFSDKSEIENLFLDCVDENRKEVLKLFTNSYANSATQKASAMQTYGNISTKILIDQVCTSKQSRTLIF